MSTNYEELIPKQVLFSIREVNDLCIIKIDMCKKLIYNREIEVVKLGKKNFISRTELIRYLRDNTILIGEFESRKQLSA